MIGTEQFSSIVARLYEAVLEPAVWTDALESIANVLGGDHAIAMIQQTDSRNVDFLAAARVDPVHLDAFRRAAGEGALKEWLRALPPAKALPSKAFLPQRALIRSDFFNHVVRPMNGYYSMAALPFVSSTARCFFVVCRPQRAGDFETSAIRRLQFLVPHIAAATRMRCRLAANETSSLQAYEALNKLNVGVILVDESANARFVNQYAETLLQQCDGLTMTRSELAAASSSETRRLHQMISASARGKELETLGCTWLRLPRPVRRGSLIVRAMPLGRNAVRFDNHAAPIVALFVHDPQKHPLPPERAIAVALGLTPRESRVAAMLARGGDVAPIAKQLGISVETVRKHLKHIYEKTNARRQADLVRLIMSLQP